jgi:hypothetical protein
MAVALYKQGTTHTIRGVLCEMSIFKHDDIANQLKNGWFKSTKEAYELQSEEPAEENKETALNFEYMSNVEIRDAAKKAGIESWETARIATLKTELS